MSGQSIVVTWLLSLDGASCVRAIARNRSDARHGFLDHVGRGNQGEVRHVLAPGRQSAVHEPVERLAVHHSAYIELLAEPGTVTA